MYERSWALLITERDRGIVYFHLYLLPHLSAHPTLYCLSSILCVYLFLYFSYEDNSDFFSKALFLMPGNTSLPRITYKLQILSVWLHNNISKILLCGRSFCKIDLSDLVQLSVWRNSKDMKNHQDLAGISVTFIISFSVHSLLMHEE